MAVIHYRPIDGRGPGFLALIALLGALIAAALGAAWYMEHSNTGVVSEFQKHLATLYGIPTYSSEEREEKQKQFWQSAFPDNKT